MMRYMPKSRSDFSNSNMSFKSLVNLVSFSLIYYNPPRFLFHPLCQQARLSFGFYRIGLSFQRYQVTLLHHSNTLYKTYYLVNYCQCSVSYSIFVISISVSISCSTSTGTSTCANGTYIGISLLMASKLTHNEYLAACSPFVHQPL
jgi:hypothetical protein